MTKFLLNYISGLRSNLIRQNERLKKDIISKIEESEKEQLEMMDALIASLKIKLEDEKNDGSQN